MEGESITQAARAEGHHPQSLRRYIIAGEAARQRDNLRGWIDENREHFNELSRSYAKNRSEEQRERDRASSFRSRRKPAARGSCSECGGPKGIDCRKSKRCRKCVLAKADQGYRELEKLWNEGISSSEISRRLGIGLSAVGATIARLRKREGYSFPPRYKLKPSAEAGDKVVK